MSTRRNAVIFYGYSLPVDFKLTEKLEAEKEIDILVDGMSGDFFLAGKKILDVGFDDYDSDDCDGTSTPQNLTIATADTTQITTKLKQLFPDHTAVPSLYYVTYWH